VAGDPSVNIALFDDNIIYEDFTYDVPFVGIDEVTSLPSLLVERNEHSRHQTSIPNTDRCLYSLVDSSPFLTCRSKHSLKSSLFQDSISLPKKYQKVCRCLILLHDHRSSMTIILKFCLIQGRSHAASLGE
jgi:hypothetical protein